MIKKELFKIFLLLCVILINCVFTETQVQNNSENNSQNTSTFSQTKRKTFSKNSFKHTNMSIPGQVDETAPPSDFHADDDKASLEMKSLKQSDNTAAVNVNDEDSPQQKEGKKPMIDIDPEMKAKVVQNGKVKAFLDALQTIVITESIQITPQVMFYVLVFIFILPSAWSIVSSFINEFPKQLFYDGCYNPVNSSETYDLYDCFICCNNRSFVYSDLIVVPERAKIGQIITTSFAGLVAILTAPAYARITLMEHLALHLLSFGVVVKTQVSALQLLPVLVFFLLFGAIAGLYTWTQSELSSAFEASILGFGDVCEANSYMAGKVLYARFNENNPSLAAGSLPRSAIDYIRAFLVVFVPFIPVLTKMYNSATSTFERISLDELVTDNVNASETFDTLKYEVEENDLMEAIEEYSQMIEDEGEGCFRLIRRFVVCVWNIGEPIPEYFGFAWGMRNRDLQAVCSILKRDGKLGDYRRNESIQKIEGGAVATD